MLLIMAIIIIGMIVYKYNRRRDNEEEINNIIEIINNTNFLEKKEEYKGYKVIGIIKVPKINIEYPILEIENINPETVKAPMKLSIVKYWGGNVNDYGNLSIAGHNNKDGTMFGKIKKLQKGDILELTDLNGQKIEYLIYNIFVTNPNDVNVLLTQNKEEREVTLITCTNGNKQRFIVKAKEV